MTSTGGGGAELTMSGAALDAFRDRGRGGVLISATLGYLIVMIAMWGAFIWLNLRGLGDYVSWYGGVLQQAASGAPPSAPEAIMPPQSVMALVPGYMLLLLLTYIVLAAYEAACLKWLVRGETGGWFVGLGLGADTWRVWFGYWIWFFLLIGMYLGVILVTLIVGMALAAARLEAGIVGVATGLTVVAALCAFLWIAVRLAPAAATSVAKNKFAFFDAWKVTRGRFWSLFGSYLLLIVLYVVAILVIYGGGLALLLGGAVGRLASQGAEPQVEDIIALFTAPNVLIGAGVVYLIAIVAAMIFFVALFGVNARAAAVAKQEGRI